MTEKEAIFLVAQQLYMSLCNTHSQTNLVQTKSNSKKSKKTPVQTQTFFSCAVVCMFFLCFFFVHKNHRKIHKINQIEIIIN